MFFVVSNWFSFLHDLILSSLVDRRITYIVRHNYKEGTSRTKSRVRVVPINHRKLLVERAKPPVIEGYFIMPAASGASIRHLSGLKDIADHYELVLCDIWGVIHNGVDAFKEAPDALHAFRAQGTRKVILLTNAPRPDWWVKGQLDSLGVREDAYDAIVTSGDVTRHDIMGRGVTKIFALGPEKDRNFYDGLPIELVRPNEAEIVSITGLIDDESETPDDYIRMLEDFLRRDLDVICANPDIVVERGEKLVYCGGALAQKYKEMGGKTHYCGKPHEPIYARAMTVGSALLGKDIDKRRVLAIGDGIATDVKGANDAGLDCLFVTGGIHSAEDGPLAEATSETVTRFLKDKNQKAEAFMPRLNW